MIMLLNIKIVIEDDHEGSSGIVLNVLKPGEISWRHCEENNSHDPIQEAMPLFAIIVSTWYIYKISQLYS
jgi:hypothetical protein